MAVFTFLGSLAAGALGLGATAAGIISAGLSAAAQLAVTYFTRQQETPPTAQARTAISQQVQFGADVPRFTVYGTQALPGHLHFYGKWGEGNLYNGFVYKLADGWCDGLEPEVYFYGERHTLISATPIGGETERWTVSGYGDLIEFRFYDGRPGQVADAKLVADTTGAERSWLSTSRLTNQAYVVVQTKFDKDKFARGRPEFTWVLRGLRVYDWRKDSTVTGGLGTHRLSDPSTWEHTSNPPVLRAAFQMGVQGTASGRTLIGQGKSFAQLHLPSYTIAANVADTDRTKNGRSFKTYQIGMVVTSEMDHTEVLSDFDDAVAGYAFNSSGLSGIVVGAPQIPAFTITDKDLDTGQEKDVRWRRESDNLFNHLTGKFTSPLSHWSPEPLTPVTVAADVAADKRKRSRGWDFTQIPDPDIAQYLLNVRYRQGRLGGQAPLPLMPKLYARAEVGEWCTWADRTWLVTGKSKKGGRRMLSLAETDASVYAEEGIAVGPIVTTPTLPAAVLAPVVTNLQVAADVIAGASDIPALRVSWTPSDDPRIDAVILEYRIQGETDAQRVRDDSPADGVFLISGLAAGADYEVRASYATTPAFNSVFTPWVQITTSNPPLVLPDETVTFAAQGREMQALLAAFERNNALLEELQAADAMRGALQQLVTHTEDSKLEALVSTFGQEAQALVLEESKARTSADEALASQSLLVRAGLGEAEATGLMKVESSVSGDGLTTSFSFFARASVADAFEEAGMVIEVVSDGATPANLTSRVAFAADKFVFDDGTQLVTIEDGTLYMDRVIVNRIESRPGNPKGYLLVDAENVEIKLTAGAP